MIIISELPYSLHLGSNKNRKNSVRSSAKNNISGTTSMTNNGIQNAKTLSKCDKHNYRKYDNEQEQIVIVKGTSSLYKDVENFYKTEFEEARLEYNNKQTRQDRKIDDYFKKVSDNSKSDLACEIIIELGDKKFWDTKDLDYKHKMTNVYSKQVDDLELLMPNFKVCSAIIHYDETSPHMHIVGVPIKYNCKTGMIKQVGKTDVFTRTSLMQLQDKMRTLCIEEYNKEYNLDATLKKKMKGRNRDINVADMTNYQETKELIEKHQKEIDLISNNSLELKSNSINIKEEINKLKKVPLRDDLFVISKEQKNKLEDYIDKVDKTTDEYRDVKELSANLNIITKQARQDSRRIKNLKESNDALQLRVDSLSEKVETQEKQIDEYRKDNFNLKYELQELKHLFEKLVNFLKRMFHRKDKEDVYSEVISDMYNHQIMSEKTFDRITGWDDIKDKEKDDYEI
ncbi:MAG: plasmid recombination protein [Bacilli bacterium]|nr:plasmid recombination protein [Bacilli bacterium]